MKVLLGVCGGVAAYKAAELTRELRRRGFDVQVAMTAGAERFVTALTFASLSGNQVLTSLWNPGTSECANGEAGVFDIEHIQIAQQVDVVLVAPATANFLAKLAHGVADDLLSTICLATTAPVLVAPAMNVNMWQHAATQENVKVLRGHGVTILAPGSGSLACGMVGEGRLVEPVAIADAVCAVVLQTRDMVGETVLITAGGTREPIDPVRFIGNRSSGKMGVALAEAALARGAEVILITAATSSSTLRCEQIRVNTAVEMQEAVLAQLHRASIVMMSAAVADYRVAAPSDQKLKKNGALTLALIQNEDILKQVVRSRRTGALVVGFAAETTRVVEEGRRKLAEKGVDVMIANDVSQPDSGFDSDQNAGVLLTRDQEIVLPLSSKREMAGRILEHLKMLRSDTVNHADVGGQRLRETLSTV